MTLISFKNRFVRYLSGTLKKFNVPLLFFFSFSRRAGFIDVTKQKSTTYRRPAWYGMYMTKKDVFFLFYELTRPRGLQSMSQEI